MVHCIGIFTVELLGVLSSSLKMCTYRQSFTSPASLKFYQLETKQNETKENFRKIWCLIH